MDKNIGLILLVVLILIVMWRHYYSLAKGAAHDWAKARGMTILDLKRCQWNLGPYFGKAFRGQEVFKVRVRDKTGMEKSGWVRVNVPWYGGIYNLSGNGPYHETWE